MSFRSFLETSCGRILTVAAGLVVLAGGVATEVSRTEAAYPALAGLTALGVFLGAVGVAMAVEGAPGWAGVTIFLGSFPLAFLYFTELMAIRDGWPFGYVEIPAAVLLFALALFGGHAGLRIPGGRSASHRPGVPHRPRTEGV